MRLRLALVLAEVVLIAGGAALSSPAVPQGWWNLLGAAALVAGGGISGWLLRKDQERNTRIRALREEYAALRDEARFREGKS